MELTAVYQARYGSDEAVGGDLEQRILGRRPRDREASRDYGRAMSAVADALAAQDATLQTPIAAVEL
jgi:hypothetical protein